MTTQETPTVEQLTEAIRDAEIDMDAPVDMRHVAETRKSIDEWRARAVANSQPRRAEDR